MVSMLTTTDNPYDPFSQFDDWYAFDEQKGYHTCGYLARICKSSEDFSEEAEKEAIEDAIDEIVSFDVLGIYKKVQKDTTPKQ